MKYSTGVSGEVELDTPFSETLDFPAGKIFVSTYISVITTAGVVAYINSAGDTMTDAAFVGRNPIMAKEILTDGTTAVGLYFSGSSESGGTP